MGANSEYNELWPLLTKDKGNSGKAIRLSRQLAGGVIGVCVGLLCGLFFKNEGLGDDVSGLLSVPGEILLRMYKVLTLPLIVSSVISAMARVELRTSGRMFLWMIGYYLLSTLAAALVGVVMVALVRPGEEIRPDLDRGDDLDPGVQVSGLDTALDFVRNMFPTNLVQACFQLHRTIRVSEAPSVFHIGLNASDLPRLLKREFEYSDGLNIFGIVVFCSVFGLFAGYMGHMAAVQVEFFSILNSICMRLANLVNWYFPLGVVFLLVHSSLTGDELGGHEGDVRVYIFTVLGGLLLHSLLLLPLCYYALVRKNPLTLARHCCQAILVGFGTSDSVASVPVTMSCLEINAGIDRRVTRFVLPIACAFNLDGTALYAVVGSIFVANLNGIQLSFEHYIIVGVVATLTSFANRGIPNAVVITMVLVLQSAGLSSKHLPLLLAVDWIMNRCRTAVNVYSQAIAAAVVAHSVRYELERSEESLRHPHWEAAQEVKIAKRHSRPALA